LIAVEETYNPDAKQSAGAAFFYQVVINGNYSAIGTSTGDHEKYQ